MLTTGISRKFAEGLAKDRAEQVRAVVAKGGLPARPLADPKTWAMIERMIRQGIAPLTAGAAY